MRLQIAAAALAFGCFAPDIVPAASQPCDARAFGVMIDQTAQALRTLNRESERRFHDRLEVIGKQRGWNESQKADKAAAAMDDSKLEAFNNDIEEYVARLDTLSATPTNEMSCSRLSELKTVQEKLISVMGQKSGFILAQLEAEGVQAPLSPYAQNPPPPQQETPVAPASPPRAQAQQPPAAAKQDGAWSANLSQTPPPRPTPRQPSQPASASTAASQKQALPPAEARADTRVASLPPSQPDPAPLPAGASGYTPDEIREAGKGLFGTLTSEFAIVMNRAFVKYGQPNAYIIGDEGGGAFLAGLRYGDGRLFARVNGSETGPTKIYWQGPSLGADLGATGSHTLFLVYNLQDPSALYKRFPGIDGSAYVAGGFGMTVYQSGDTLIVPIRTGLGLRLGASIAYLKFTERASWNPF